MSAYYNEIEPFAAQWLRNLIAKNLIAPGDVDTRSIVDVHPDDLKGYTQCHFFAGIGGWSYALRLAGWADDRPVWTGSCPCQPFSTAGKQRGSDDERHLWPAFFRLIRECRPASVFGEQVAGSAGYAWWDHVAADLEGEGYTAAAVDIGAHSVGAPHIRQRLYWVANSDGVRCKEHELRVTDLLAGRSAAGRMADAKNVGRQPRPAVARIDGARMEPAERQSVIVAPTCKDATGRMADAEHDGRDRQAERAPSEQDCHQSQQWISDGDCPSGDMGDANHKGLEGRRNESGKHSGQFTVGAASPWRDLAWLPCSDGKARPTQPGLFPLAHGVSGRVGRLRAYGNAIVPQVAAAFIRAAA